MDTPIELLLNVALAPAVRLGATLLLRGSGVAARRLLVRWRQRRDAARTATALRALDRRALRDLGLDRSEVDSVAAETSGGAARTRGLAARLTSR